MKMGQTKVPNKLGIQANIIRANETDSCLQNQHVKNKQADLKTRKMMKSRSIKLSKLETRLKSSPKRHDQPGWQPSPRKASPSESPCTFPSYMRSTRSSEAKKEQLKAGNSGLSKLQRVARTLSRISSLKKVRTLTRRNKYVQSATCSSTQKELKFPTKLILDPGATEAEGRSVVKVCSYNHCSLNRHDCTPPSLKSFLSSKRRLLKAQKIMPFAPVQDQASYQCSYKRNDYLEGNSITVNVDESFGETFDMESKEGKISSTWPVLVQSENGDNHLKGFLGDKLRPYHHEEITRWQHCSDVESVSDCESMMPGEQRFEEPNTLEEEDHTNSRLENEIAEDDSSLADDSTICYTNTEVTPTDEQGGSFSVPVDELTENRAEFEEKKARNNAAQKEDVDLSKDDSVPDWKSIQTGLVLSHNDGTRECSFSYVASGVGEVQLKEPNIIKEHNEIAKGDSSPVNDSIICHTDQETKSIDERHSCLSDPIDEAAEVREDVDFCKYPIKADGDEGNEEHCTSGEIGGKVNADIIIEQRELTDNTSKGILRKINETEFSSIKEASDAVNSSEAEFEQKEAGNGAEPKEIKPNKFILEISGTFKGQSDISTVKFNHNKNSFVEEKAPEMDDISSTVELDVFPIVRINQSGQTKHSCNKFKRSTRCKKADEDCKKAREFNPRGPNFLPVEPDPEAERVVLRHKEMDERRSAEEWMLDHALQKAVNRLASARTRNVALLVEAFETVTQNRILSPSEGENHQLEKQSRHVSIIER